MSKEREEKQKLAKKDSSTITKKKKVAKKVKPIANYGMEVKVIDFIRNDVTIVIFRLGNLFFSSLTNEKVMAQKYDIDKIRTATYVEVKLCLWKCFEL